VLGRRVSRSSNRLFNHFAWPTSSPSSRMPSLTFRSSASSASVASIVSIDDRENRSGSSTTSPRGRSEPSGIVTSSSAVATPSELSSVLSGSVRSYARNRLACSSKPLATPTTRSPDGSTSSWGLASSSDSASPCASVSGSSRVSCGCPPVFVSAVISISFDATSGCPSRVTP